MGAPQGSPGQEDDDGPQAIAWKAPAKWKVVPSTNAMRLATYRVPAAPGVADEAELTVVRAGGSIEANFQRWIGQFTDAEPPKRTEKRVRGLTVSILEVTGTFGAASMAQPNTAVSHRAWSLWGAVVETAQGTYFFKLTGPSASVRAARGDLDALVESIAPARR